MRSAVLAIAAVLGSASIAAAQPALTPVEAPPPPRDTASSDASPTTATILSLGGAAAGIATIWMGSKMHDGDTPIMELGAAIALVAPSSGEWYAHGNAYFTPGLAIRLGGGLIMALGFGAALDHSCQAGTCEVPIRDHNSDALIGLGATVAVGGMIFDIAAAASEARKMNRRRIAIEPTVMQTSRGTTTGLGLGGSF